MNKLFAIAVLAVRTASRSRLLLCLVILLLLAVVGVPLTVKGDGTLHGHIRVLLHYALGLAAVILSLATLWAAAGGIAREVEDKRIRLVAVKPVHSGQIWLGKWLGLLVMNAVLLALAAAIVYGLLLWRLRSVPASDESRHTLNTEVLTARRLVRPLPEDVDADVHQRMTDLVARGKIPPQMPANQVFAALKKELLARRAAVGPGRSKSWTFVLPPIRPRTGPRDEAAHAVAIRFRLSSAAMDKAPISGTWTVGTPERPETFQFTMAAYPDGLHTFFVPVSTLGLPSSRGDPVHTRVTFTNADTETSATAIFVGDAGIEMLIRERSFEFNLVRALSIVLATLAVVAALGLTLSTAFSAPVATFVAAALITMSLMCHYFSYATTPERMVREDSGADGGPSLVYVATEKAIGLVNKAIVQPVMQFRPLGALSDGILITPLETARAWLLLVIVYPGVFGILGSFLLWRRELALPG